MKKIVRIGTPADQDRFRRNDIAQMSPDQRVDLLLDMQRRFFDVNHTPIKRIATVRRLGGIDYAP